MIGSVIIMNKLRLFIRYLGIGVMATFLGTFWGGPGLIGMALLFGAPALIINALVLTVISKEDVK